MNLFWTGDLEDFPDFTWRFVPGPEISVAIDFNPQGLPTGRSSEDGAPQLIYRVAVRLTPHDKYPGCLVGRVPELSSWAVLDLMNTLPPLREPLICPESESSYRAMMDLLVASADRVRLHEDNLATLRNTTRQVQDHYRQELGLYRDLMAELSRKLLRGARTESDPLRGAPENGIE